MNTSDSKEFFKISKAQYFIYFVFVIICFFSYYFIDIESTTRHGINVWKSLFEGKFFQFYSYNANPYLFGIQHSAIYEMPLYIVFALWNFPLYIIEVITKTNCLNNTFGILYSKGILILFFFLTIKIFLKICDEFDFSTEKKQVCTFFWVSSFLVIEPLFVICQYDIIALFFILNGILSYMKKNNRKFIIWFAFSMFFKSLSFFIFLPLLLIRKKNIFQILIDLIFCMLPFLLCKMIFLLSDPTYKNIPPFTSILYMLVDNTTWPIPLSLDKNTISNTFSFPLGKPTIFFSLYFAFLLICYFFIDKITNFISLFISTVSLSMLFVFLSCSPYWIILLSPFSSLLCFHSDNKCIIYKNLILELLFSGSIIFVEINKYYMCFNYTIIQMLLAKYSFFSSLPVMLNNTYQINHIFGFFDYITVPCAVGIFSASLIVFLIHIYYYNRKSNPNENITILFKTLNPFFWIRTSVIGFVSILQVLLVLIAKLRI